MTMEQEIMSLPGAVVCVGESMVMLVPEDARPIAANSRLALRVGGAESNVAMSLARLGHQARWVSALGADAFGDIIRDELAAAGVDVSAVRTNNTAPTGLYVKHPQRETTRVSYYRAQSAASTLNAHDITPEVRAGADVVHVSGITPALSESCAALIHSVVNDRVFGDATVSFDVNYRPGLWPVAEAGPVLASLARRADVVFVGRDEAELLWGTKTAVQIRDFLPEPATLIVKDGAVEATSFTAEGVTVIPSLRVDVVETVGAGDAFAAGWWSGRLRGLGAAGALALGHLIASRAVQIIGDTPAAPSEEEIHAHLSAQREGTA